MDQRTPADCTHKAVALWHRQADLREQQQSLREQMQALAEEWDANEEALGRLVPGLPDSLEIQQGYGDDIFVVRVENSDVGPCVTVRPLQPAYRLQWPPAPAERPVPKLERCPCGCGGFFEAEQPHDGAHAVAVS